MCASGCFTVSIMGAVCRNTLAANTLARNADITDDVNNFSTIDEANCKQYDR